MKKECVTKAGILSIILIILSINYVGALNKCISPDQVIMRISSDTNAHAEIFNGNGNYDTEICYNQLFSDAPIPGIRVCNGENIVLKLSSDTNAHAENPLLNNYAVSVCYRDLKCEIKTSCATEEVAVLRFSAATNAHLEPAFNSNYDSILCCSSTSAPGTGCTPSCSLGKICSEGECVDIPVAPDCGNGIVNDGEGCDGTNFKGKSCPSLVPNSRGNLICSQCIINTEGCIVDGPPVEPTPEVESRAFWANINENEFADGAIVKIGTSVFLIATGASENSKITFTILDRDSLSESFDVIDDKIVSSPEVLVSNGRAIYRWNIVPSDYERGRSGENDRTLELYFIARGPGYDETSALLLLNEDIVNPNTNTLIGCDKYNDEEYVEALVGDPTQSDACNSDLGKNLGNDPSYEIKNDEFENQFGIGCNEEDISAGRQIKTTCACRWINDGCQFSASSTINFPDSDGDGVICAPSCDYRYERTSCIDNFQTISSVTDLLNTVNCNPGEIEEAESFCSYKDPIEISCGITRLQLPLFGLLQFLTSFIMILFFYLLFLKKIQMKGFK